jgi:hypothetical protein
MISSSYAVDAHTFASFTLALDGQILTSLYDSASMQSGNRMQALHEMVHNIARFATKLEPSGMSIHFLNFDQDEDGDFDNLNDLDSIDQKVKMVGSHGSRTRLGVELDQKVYMPIVKKAKSNALKKPVIVAVITDGEVSDDGA